MLQPEKLEFPIEVTVEGIVSDSVKPLQFSNVYSFIAVIFADNEIDFIPEQPEKAWYPREVTDKGIVSDPFKLLQ